MTAKCRCPQYYRMMSFVLLACTVALNGCSRRTDEPGAYEIVTVVKVVGIPLLNRLDEGVSRREASNLR